MDKGQNEMSFWNYICSKYYITFKSSKMHAFGIRFSLLRELNDQRKNTECLNTEKQETEEKKSILPNLGSGILILASYSH